MKVEKMTINMMHNYEKVDRWIIYKISSMEVTKQILGNTSTKSQVFCKSTE